MKNVLKKLHNRKLRMLCAAMACAWSIALYAAWYWHQEKLYWQYVVKQGENCALQLDKRHDRGHAFQLLQAVPMDVLSCVQDAANTAHVQLVSCEGRHQDKEFYEITLNGSFFDILTFFMELERNSPSLSITAITIIPEESQLDALKCTIIV